MVWFTSLPFLQWLDCSCKKHYHEARFEKDTRYYVIRLETDLFGDWTISVINGRIKSKLGQTRLLAYPYFADAFESFCDLAHIRHKRSYLLKTYRTDDHLLRHLITTLFYRPICQSLIRTIASKPQKPKPLPKRHISTSTKPQSSHQFLPQQMGLVF